MHHSGQRSNETIDFFPQLRGWKKKERTEENICGKREARGGIPRKRTKFNRVRRDGNGFEMHQVWKSRKRVYRALRAIFLGRANPYAEENQTVFSSPPPLPRFFSQYSRWNIVSFFYFIFNFVMRDREHCVQLFVAVYAILVIFIHEKCFCSQSITIISI